MKKIILSVAIVAALFTACKKDAVQPQNQTAITPVIQPSTDRYYYQGKQVTKADIGLLKTANHWLVVEDNGVYTYSIFDTEEELQNFAITTPQGDMWAEKIGQVNAARLYATEHNVDEVYEKTGVMPADYTAYINSIAGASKRGVGLLFDDLNAGGDLFPISGNPQPKLPGFNDRAESAKGAGLANMIFDHVRFKGSSRYLLLGTGVTLDFDGFDFQNRASSAW